MYKYIMVFWNFHQYITWLTKNKDEQLQQYSEELQNNVKYTK